MSAAHDDGNLIIMRRLLVAASRGTAAVASAVAAQALSAAEGDASRCEGGRRPRVLITGFHDWRDVAENLWRCRDNPSCRLLLGPPSETPPIRREGALVQALKQANIRADFTFQTLPVTWGTANGLDLAGYDIVIHLGLGVYDSHNTILLEHGAFNLRGEGRDALNRAGTGEAIESGAQKHMKLESGMLKRLADLRRQPSTLTPASGGAAPFVVVEAPSRKENAYICNETHWRALRAVEASVQGADARPQAAYFVHIPYANPKRERAYEELAAAVAALIGRVVALEVEA